MEIYNRTPLRFALLAGRVDYPKHSLTLIVKGTFDLHPDDVASLAEDQPYPTGDEPYPDDEEGTGAPRYENDYAPFKPRADLLLVGTCYPPNRREPFCRATFSVGQHSKTLLVMGDRQWKGLLPRPSDPEPLSSLEIRYESSFGGVEFAANPVGKGRKPVRGEDGGKHHPLPNIEHPDRLIRSKGDKPDPVGFGPMGRLWTHRLSKTGTYDDAWKETRFPGFPEDFDWGHFNAAQPDLQVKGYLRGDEDVVMENLHPEVSRYETGLPGLRLRCFIEEAVEDRDVSARFDEVTMNLDTLWVDMESETMVLVWRGVIEVDSEDFEEVGNVLVTSENVADARSTVEQNQNLLCQILAESEEEFAEEKEKEDEPGPEPIEAKEDQPDEIMAEILAVKKMLPPEPPPIDPAPLTEEEKKYLEELGIGEEKESPSSDDEPAEQELTREYVERLIAKKEPLSDMDLRGLDLSKLVAAEVDFTGSNLSGVALTGAELVGAILAGVNLEGADMTDSVLSQANLTKANLKGTLLVGADLQEADFTGSDMSAADLTSAKLKDAVLLGAQMQRAKLEQVEAGGAAFEGANLDDACVESSNLDATSFRDASLQRTSFRASSLRDSTWSGVTGHEVVLDHAELGGLRAAGCDLTRGSIREARAEESIWQKAILSEADFSCSDMAGSNFIGATLNKTTFEAADLRFARFDKADLRGARMVDMNLFQGSVEKADLTNADLSGSNMYGVEFLEATLKKTVSRGTNLKMAPHFKSRG